MLNSDLMNFWEEESVHAFIKVWERSSQLLSATTAFGDNLVLDDARLIVYQQS